MVPECTQDTQVTQDVGGTNEGDGKTAYEGDGEIVTLSKCDLGDTVLSHLSEQQCIIFQQAESVPIKFEKAYQFFEEKDFGYSQIKKVNG
jgi:hypothetical protein